MTDGTLLLVPGWLLWTPRGGVPVEVGTSHALMLVVAGRARRAMVHLRSDGDWFLPALEALGVIVTDDTANPAVLVHRLRLEPPDGEEVPP